MSGQDSFEVVMCSRLIGEISDVLDRPRLRKRISADDAREFVAMISILANRCLTRRRSASRPATPMVTT